MVELDSLDRNIRTLKELQRVAWQQLADRSATTLECQDLRNQLRHTGKELRYYLEMNHNEPDSATSVLTIMASGSGTLGKKPPLVPPTTAFTHNDHQKVTEMVTDCGLMRSYGAAL